MTSTSKTRPAGITALSLFFFAGAAISALACVSLLLPGSLLNPIWRVNPRGHEAFTSMGGWASVLLAVVCVACASAGFGLWRGARWGYWLAIAMLCANLLGDVANVLLGIDYRAAIGVPIVLAILAFLVSGRVRSFFGSPASG